MRTTVRVRTHHDGQKLQSVPFVQDFSIDDGHYVFSVDRNDLDRAMALRMKTLVQAALTSFVGLVAFGLLVFVPAGTFDYWRGWAFIAVFAAATLIPSAYLAVTNPDALRRRMQAGPAAETRPVQKVIIVVAFLSMGAMIAISALDFRFGWSTVSAAVSVVGLVLVAVGLTIAMLVTIQNGYAAANVTVESAQQLSSTGWYGFVRHPMYFGNVILMIGIPLALGSYWALLIVVPSLTVLAVRINDEEAMLKQELAGYRANVATAGVAAPVLSTIEDGISVGLVLLAILLPVVVLVVLALLIWAFFQLWRRRRRRQAAAAQPT